jgi:hypothetical protein
MARPTHHTLAAPIAYLRFAAQEAAQEYFAAVRALVRRH